jgi:hypothetical protein
MSLNIVLDEPSKPVYTAGDLIKGRVVLESTRDEAIGKLEITFLGRTKTRIRKRKISTREATYRGRGTLFWYSEVLYEGHYTVRADKYEWPFEFTFPYESRGRSVDDQFNRHDPFRTNSDVHALPPSFSHTGAGFNTGFECIVEYKLEAVLSRPPESYKLFSSGLDTGHALHFLPWRTTQNPDFGVKAFQQSLAAQTLRLLPEKADAKLTMKERMKSTFKMDDLPIANFAILITYPTTIYPGGPFPLHLSMKHISTTVEDRPTVFLESVNVVAKTRICVRAPGFLVDYYDDDSLKRRLFSKSGLHTPVTESSSDLPAIELVDTASWLDLGQEINTLSLPPDFSTYNIAISTKMDVTIEVTCADKKFKITNDFGLIVLPPVYLRTQDVLHAPPAVTVADPAEPLAPPPYEPALRYDSAGESSSMALPAEKSPN